ncbi:MAG: aminotransferase class I/II-fold pyridoxal phosphate-dependent enzyme, partial [Moorea sp. SIO2B7]|nr:aminotransferase class I/II-fold pyridoxal phosphate-dependent enzyme [Moorena sp. SIO2B7]
ELLNQQAGDGPNQILYTFLKDGETKSGQLTYRQLQQQAQTIATHIQDCAAQGSRVLLLYPSSLEFICAFFGCLYAGMIAVPAYPPRPNQKLNRLRAIATDAQAEIALTTTSLLPKIQKCWTKDSTLPSLYWLATDALVASNPSKLPDIVPENPAFLQYTSGSTGKPKGVVISHQNLMHNLGAIQASFGHTSKLRGVIWLPFYHDMGLVGGILQALYVGGSVMLMNPTAFLQKPIRWLQAISRYRATTSGGPNFAYDLCIRKIKPEHLAGLDLSSWEIAFNGAEPIRAETLQRFSETFAPYGFRSTAFYPCYGMAEATLLVAGGNKHQAPVIKNFFDADSQNKRKNNLHVSPGKASRLLVGCGYARWGQTAIIVDPVSLTKCAEEEEGEIWVAGESVAQGYWNRKEETQETFAAYLADTGEGPFLRTGDLGFLTKRSPSARNIKCTDISISSQCSHQFDWELFITGRLKDVLVIRGQNYYPQDLELTVEKSHPALSPYGTAAFMVEIDRENRLVVAAEVERTYLKKLPQEADTIIRLIRKVVLDEHGVQLYRILFLKPGSLPKTSSGKIQRYACRTKFCQGTLPFVYAELQKENEIAPISHNPRTLHSFTVESIQTWLSQWLARQLNLDVHSINSQGSFAEYGLDSAKAAELLQDLEAWSWYSLDMAVLLEFPTIAALSQHLSGELASRNSKVSPQTNSLEEIQPISSSQIPEEYYRLECYPEYRQLQKGLGKIEALGIVNPYFKVHEKIGSDLLQMRSPIDYSSYDYLGFAADPAIKKAAKAAIDLYGTSVSASRLASGERSLHRELEKELARFIGVEDCIVYVSGHATNVTTIGHLFGPQDLIIYDAFSHNSILQGCTLSGATALSFPHNDWQALEQLLQAKRNQYRRVLIAIEGVYSMEGDIPDLPRFIELKERYKTLLLVDEAHSLGVLGCQGRGIGEYFGIEPTEVDLWMGTLSKTLASCGGYIAGSKALVKYLKYTAPGFVYSVGLSPPNAAAALASLQILQTQSDRVEILRQRSQYFLKQASDRGWNTGASENSAIIPLIIGDSLQCIQLSESLLNKGIHVHPMIYPSVPNNVARLRFFIRCTHTEEQINQTISVISP